MTDVEVEDKVIDYFLNLPALQTELKLKKFWDENEDDLKTLTYEEIKDEEEVPVTDFLSFVSWFYFYTSLPEDSDRKTIEEDSLIVGINEIINTEADKKNEYGEYIVQNFPSVAFENIDFARGVDGNKLNTPWYELWFRTTAPMQIELGTEARSRWVGVLLVTICVPKTWGKQEINTRYNDLASLFRSGINIDGVRITRTYRTSALDDDDYYCMPVTIEWWADLDR